MKRNKGLTLLEIVFTLTLIVLLTTSVFLLYMVSIRGWHHLGNRQDLHEDLHFALERVVRDAREATSQCVANHAIRVNVGGTHSIYYLHHASDTWPPAFSQSLYNLLKATTTNADGNLCNDTFTYGNGEIVARDLTAPTSGVSITESSDVITIVLEQQKGDDTMKIRGIVRPRNV